MGGQSDGRIARRGLIAGLTALVAGLLAKASERVAQAADGGNLILGSTTNQANSQTILTRGAGTPPATNYAFQAFGGTGFGGLYAEGTMFSGVRGQVAGTSGSGSGVHGQVGTVGPDSLRTAGVHGSCQAHPGVMGDSTNNIGVYGLSATVNGVLGEIPASSTANAIAIYGRNNSSYAGPGPGAGGFGVYGLCAKGHGLVGATATAGGAAVVGATNGVAGAWAGAFYGPVIIGGDFIVVGGAKSAAVPHPDGSHRQLYCVESAESWFEDFGTGTLVNGKAEVAIEAGFGAVADMDNYHVFLTAYDNDHLLHVTKRTSEGFTVEANAALAALLGHNKADLTGTFSWRVVAKRKDIVGERLAKVTMPPEPVLPSIEDRPMTQRPTHGPEAVTN